MSKMDEGRRGKARQAEVEGRNGGWGSGFECKSWVSQVPGRLLDQGRMDTPKPL